MKTEPIAPQMPFVWPEPRVSAGVASYSSDLPFESAVRSAVTVFGVVSAVDSRAINWMEGFLADQVDSQLRLVVSIHPTCRTTEADLEDLIKQLEDASGDAQVKCRALWALITTGNEVEVVALINAIDEQKEKV